MSRTTLKQGDRIPLTGATTTRQHRTLDERVFVRLPALARAVLYLWSRLPAGSRLRRFLLKRAAGQVLCAVNRRDWDVLLLVLDSQIDYRAISAGSGVGAVIPDLVGHHHGHTSYVQLWRTLLESIEDATQESEELLDFGDRVISVSRLSGHGRSSGVPVNLPLFQALFLRRGLVVKQEDFGTREEALQAAGVSE